MSVHKQYNYSEYLSNEKYFDLYFEINRILYEVCLQFQRWLHL